jgi:hypothetical protein
MNIVKTYMKVLAILLILIVGSYGFVHFYSYIFSKTIIGKIEKVERVQVNVALMQGSSDGNADHRMSPDLFSFAVAIRTPDGEVFTASAEDRQWAAVSEGLCVTAKFFPYPPWKLDKSGTFFGARLLESRVCN